MPVNLATLDGTVVNAQTRQPIAGATVQVRALPDPTPLTSVRTRANGSFQLTLDPSRTYAILTSANGYKSLEEKLAFSDQRAVRLYGKEIRLEIGTNPPRPATTLPVSWPVIQFAPRRSDLLPEAVSSLRQVAALLAANPTIRLEAVGHTDTIGDIALNRLLAAERAEAVRDFLAQLGVDRSRIDVQSYGGSKPLPGPLSPTTRARNKRVELRVVPAQ